MSRIKHKNLRFSTLDFAWLFFLTAGFLATTSWSADMLKQLIEGNGAYYQDNPVIAALYLAGWAASGILLYRSRRRFVPTKTLYETQPSPHKVLIMLVSPPNIEASLNGESLTIPGRNGTEQTITFTNDLPAMIELLSEKGIHWNWQQNMRSLAVHSKGVEQVVLLGSCNAPGGKPNGSVNRLEEITRLLTRFVPRARFHDNREEPCDFNKMEHLRHTIVHWVEEMEGLGYRQEDIIVDVTGGTKTASIAAALATLTLGGVEFQYIPERGQVAQAYNVVVTSQANLE